VVLGQAKAFERLVGQAQGQGLAARAYRVEEVKHLLVGHLGGEGNLREVQVREAGADAAAFGHHAGHAEADVVGALVADDLRRHAGHGLAFHHGRAVLV